MKITQTTLDKARNQLTREVAHACGVDRSQAAMMAGAIMAASQGPGDDGWWLEIPSRWTISGNPIQVVL